MEQREPSGEEKRRWLAEARMFDAEARSSDQLARKLKYEATSAKLVASASVIELEREKYRRRVELSQNEYHRVYYFSDGVSAPTVGRCMETLSRWIRLDAEDDASDRPYTIVFTSPGGDIVAGNALYDFIVQRVRRKHGHHVRTESLGYAASMAGVLLQAGDVRVLAPESWMLIHQGSMGAIGNFEKVIDTVKWVERIHERFLDIFAEGCARAPEGTATDRLSRTDLQRRWEERKEWWISSDEALRYGLVDAVE